MEAAWIRHEVRPEVIKARLGYACDQYEAVAYVVTGAIHKPLISHAEAKWLGKRIQNIIGKSGSIGKQLKLLRKRGKTTASQVAALLGSNAALSFEPPACLRRPSASARARAAVRARAAASTAAAAAAATNRAAGRQSHPH